MPKLVFVGGHGRADENIHFAGTGSVTVEWFGNLGNPTKKSFSKAILAGKITKPIAVSTGKSLIPQHFTCASVALEYIERAKVFLKGPWDSEAYFVQAKQGFHVPLSNMITLFTRKWQNETITIRWAVCRSSLVSGKSGAHDFEDGRGTFLVPEPSDQPSIHPSGEAMGDSEGALYFQQFGKPLLNYGKTDFGQLVNMQGDNKPKRTLTGAFEV